MKDDRTTEKMSAEQEARARLLVGMVRDLAMELHPDIVAKRIQLDSVLERDAGIDSLGRIELLLRIERATGLVLPEEEAVGAEKIRDLLDAFSRAIPSSRSFATTTVPAKEGAGAIAGEAKRGGTESRGFFTETEESAIPVDVATLAEMLEWHVERHPERIHLRLFVPNTETTVPVTYGDLYREALRVTGGLQSYGILPGNTVGIMLPTGIEYLNLFFGILLAGGIPVPIYPPQRMAQIEEHLKRQFGILRNAGAKLLVTTSDALRLRPLIKSALPDLNEVITYNDLISEDSLANRTRILPGDTAFLQYTSGSTGNPKGVVLSHANLLANVRAMGKAVEVVPSDIFVSWLPLYHDMGLIGAWFGTLYHGIPLVLMSPLSFIARPIRWLRAIHQYGGTLSAAPNFAYELCSTRISDEELQGLDLSRWRRALNGAEPVLPDTLERFAGKFSSYGFRKESLAPVFGLAENSVGLLFPPPGRGPHIDRIRREAFLKEKRALPAQEGDTDALRFVSCGSPIEENEIRIVDENGRDVNERTVGRLLFRSPSSTSRYHENPEATESLFRGTWLDSGDYAYLADGEVYIAGRAKELIIRGGRNIYPYELEEAVGEIEGVRKGGVAVFGSADPVTNAERLVVLAETRERNPKKRERIREQIVEKSSQLYQIPPDDIVLADLRTVLKTSSGKIRRATCRALYESGDLGRKRSVWLQMVRLFVSGLPTLAARWKKRSLELAYSGWGWFVISLIAPFAWAGVVFSPFLRMRYGIIRFFNRSIIVLTGTTFRIHGKERLRGKVPPIIVSNHASYLDPLFIVAAFPMPLRFVAKAELQKKFFVNLFLSRLGVTYVERFDAKGGLENVRGLQSEGTGPQNPIVFFAEGTFNEVPGLRPFRMGAFVIAEQSGADILPVSLKGTREKMRDVDFFLRRGDVELTICEPMHATKTGWEGSLDLRERVRLAILEHCGERDYREGRFSWSPGASDSDAGSNDDSKLDAG